MTPLKIGDRVKILSSTRFHPNRAGIGQTGEVRRLETKEMVIVDCADGAQRRYMLSDLALSPAAPEVAGGETEGERAIYRDRMKRNATAIAQITPHPFPVPVAAAAPGVDRDTVRDHLAAIIRDLKPAFPGEVADSILARFTLTPKG